MQTEIVTKRLRLRRARPGDVDALHELVSDFDVIRSTASWPYPPDRTFTASRCAPMAPGDGMMGPVLLEDKLVGMMGVDARDGFGELGYMFARAHWGRGFATEIATALIAHAWARYDWPRIEACVFTDNPGSGRVLDKLGFVEGAACMGDCAARGGRFATRTYSLVRP